MIDFKVACKFHFKSFHFRTPNAPINHHLDALAKALFLTHSEWAKELAANFRMPVDQRRNHPS